MTEQQPPTVSSPDISVRPLKEADLLAADYIFRLAFGTFIGLPDPLAFGGDADYVRTRWRADPAAAFGAEADRQLVGSNFATNWGSVGFFGPLTVHPDLWNKGVATRLLEPTMKLFRQWGIRHAGLFTFAQSAKHVSLYQKFGFWPRFLTALMAKSVAPPLNPPGWSSFSAAPPSEQAEYAAACRALADAAYEGLDLTREIRAAQAQGLGDTVLVWDGSRLAAFGVCHCGPGSEAGSDVCYVKFGAARPGPAAAEAFSQLLLGCEALAAARGLGRLVAGVNAGRAQAYRQMLTRGFRATFQGVVMQRPDEPGYNRPDVYLIDDWR